MVGSGIKLKTMVCSKELQVLEISYNPIPMKKNAKSFFSKFQVQPEPEPRQDTFRISKGTHDRKRGTPSQDRVHSFDKSTTTNMQPERSDLSSLSKYQSYLHFINEGQLEIQDKQEAQGRPHPNQPYITKRRPHHQPSKTPVLEVSLLHPDEMERRRSMLERRRISPYLDKPLTLSKKQKSAAKKDSSRRRMYNSQDQTNRKEKEDSVTEERMQKALFEGIEFFRDLGKGAHAVVRSAIDWKNRRKIAVKVYKKQELNEEELESITSEIMILRSIKHSNIAQLYSVIETTKTINLVMEYGGGNSLFQHIRSKHSGHFQESEARILFKQILEAISYLHDRNVVHRDIKPENILLNKANQVKIIDFGFSLISGLDDKVDSYCGTVTYMAPQIVTKKPHIGIYADRWSLGVLLYTLLQGAFPFRAASETQLFSKISRGQFEYVVSISPEASQLIESLMVMKPGSRLSAKEALQSSWMKKG